MASSGSFWTDRTIFKPDRADPYLHLHFVLVFVRHQERSHRFYVDQLGFSTLVDHTFDTGDRWIEVAPPDGTAKLALVPAQPGSDEEKSIGRFTNIFFLTEDVNAKYHEWRERGVEFDFPPQHPPWGGMITRFRDLDGNGFGLAGFDEATRAVEAQRGLLAARAEGERRYHQEIAIAREVQARLLPQSIPTLPSLDCAAACLQARQIGGDYYYFLDLGPGALGFAIADISGKGLGAALLMANLQAALRGHSARALESPEGFLGTLNRIFYKNSPATAYATLFFAAYDERTRELTYVNCGHLPGLVARPNGTLDHLHSTATVLGLFADWHCSAQSYRFEPGDALVLYTDGVTESVNAVGEDFGDARLAQVLLRHRDSTAEEILRAIFDEIRSFSTAEQQDDITAVVVKSKAAPSAAAQQH